MFRQQPIADATDAGAVRGVACLHREVALGIQPHRSPRGLADPIRTSTSSTTITFEWTNVGTFCARDAAGYTSRRRSCASASISVLKTA